MQQIDNEKFGKFITELRKEFNTKGISRSIICI